MLQPAKKFRTGNGGPNISKPLQRDSLDEWQFYNTNSPRLVS